MKPGQKMPLDTGNPLLAQGPALINGGVIGPPGDEIAPGLAPPMDLGNPLQKPDDVRLDAGTMWEPGGSQIAILTWYSPSTTHTVLQTAEEVKAWAGKVAKLADHVHGGRIGVLVVCSATTRFTMFLKPADFRAQSQVIAGLSASMSGSGLIVAPPGSVLPPGPDGHRRLN